MYLDLFSMKLVTYIFFFLKHVTCWLFVCETCCAWINSSRNSINAELCFRETFYIFIPSSWNLWHDDFSHRKTSYIDFSPRETGFVHGTFCVLIFCFWDLIYLNIFLRETSCMWIFLRETFVGYFFIRKSCYKSCVKHKLCFTDDKWTCNKFHEQKNNMQYVLRRKILR